MKLTQGSKREITLRQWNQTLQMAQNKLSDSKKSFQLFGGNEHRIEEDKKEVQEIERHIREVIEIMDKNNIQ